METSNSRNGHVIGTRCSSLAHSAKSAPFTTSIMFKGILLSKRISSSDFTMIAGPGISDNVAQFGKEIQNQPDIISQQTALKSTKGFIKSNEKEKEKTLKSKEKKREGKDQSGEPIMTEVAFDKLLVRKMKFLWATYH